MTIAPFPIMVVTTGTFIFSANSFNSSFAFAILTPPPARINGFFADFNSLYAFFNCPICTLSFGLYPRICTLSGYSAGPLAVWISFGRSIKTGPGFPVLAMWKAILMIFPKSLRSLTVTPYFVILLVIPTMSTSWKASFPIRLNGTCPVKQTSGILS